MPPDNNTENEPLVRWDEAEPWASESLMDRLPDLEETAIFQRAVSDAVDNNELEEITLRQFEREYPSVPVNPGRIPESATTVSHGASSPGYIVDSNGPLTTNRPSDATIGFGSSPNGFGSGAMFGVDTSEVQYRPLAAGGPPRGRGRRSSSFFRGRPPVVPERVLDIVVDPSQGRWSQNFEHRTADGMRVTGNFVFDDGSGPQRVQVIVTRADDHSYSETPDSAFREGVEVNRMYVDEAVSDSELEAALRFSRAGNEQIVDSGRVGKFWGG